jgi:hypothetical protein
MNRNYQEKINKIITVLDTLLAKCSTVTTQQQQDQATLADLVNKLKSEELKEIEALGKLGDTHLTEKGEWLSQKASLEKDLRESKEALTSEKKKLGEDLVKKIEDLASPAKLTDLKLSETDRKESVKELQENQPKGTNYWGASSCILAGITCLLTAITLFIKGKENKEINL